MQCIDDVDVDGKPVTLSLEDYTIYFTYMLLKAIGSCQNSFISSIDYIDVFYSLSELIFSSKTALNSV